MDASFAEPFTTPLRWSLNVVCGFHRVPILNRPTTKLDPVAHLTRLWEFRNSSKYSALHRFQKWSWIILRCFALLLRSFGEILKSSSTGVPATARALIRRPITRWTGVRGSSRSSDETCEIGRQFRIISASITTVTSSSYDTLARPIVY